MEEISHIPKIICNITGGLGNQLFILFTGLALAKKFNRELVVVFREEGDRPLGKEHDMRDTFLRKVKTIPEIPTDTSTTIVIKEDRHKMIVFDLSNIQADVRIEGYFQSYDYFKEYEKLCYDTLYLTINEKTFIDEYVAKLREKQTGMVVGIQVRRGQDYLSLNWTLSSSYYHFCISQFPANTKFVISTDDVLWCKAIFPSAVIIENVSNYVKMYIMSKLDGLILSNSSFGLWMAYIGKTERVFVPYPWLPAERKYNEGIYLSHWKKVNRYITHALVCD
jgi:hypothetical protein